MTSLRRSDPASSRSPAIARRKLSSLAVNGAPATRVELTVPPAHVTSSASISLPDCGARNTCAVQLEAAVQPV
ncbi:MAG: hypothetical protein M5U28_31060 [Sandaracinaceae bacterium]|nr:hypothetical protein [Sandaracinaceae bacterium]